MSTTPRHRFNAYPRALAWAPDGERLAVGLDSGGVALMSPNARCLREIPAHDHALLGLSWNPVSGILATGGEDGRVRLWSSDGAGPIADLAGGAAWVEHVAWASDGRALATAAGRFLRFWNAEGGDLGQHRSFGSTISGLAWRGIGGVLAASSYGEVRLLEPGDPGVVEVLAWPSSLTSVAWSPDGAHLAAGTQEKTISYWPMPSNGEPPLQMSGYPAKVKCLVWDRASRFLATAGGQVVTVWDVSGPGPAGTTPARLEGHGDRVSALHWQPAGDLLASGALDGSVWLWNIRTGGRGMPAARLPSAIAGLAWTPDGARLAVVAEDGTLVVAGG